MNEHERAKAYDVLILGAGIIGVSSAIHLQARGKRVCMIDLQAPGMHTSYGNAGLIERSAVVPYAFPRSLLRTLKYALNRQPDVHYHMGELLKMSGWLWEFWLNSGRKRLAEATWDMLPLIERSISEHAPLMEKAGVSEYVRKRGWIDVFRHPQHFKEAVEDAKAVQKYGVDFDILDGKALREKEPGVLDALIGGVYWKDPWTLEDPQAIVQGYAKLFTDNGGTFLHADARGLRKSVNQWVLDDVDGNELRADEVVVALGPDTNAILERLDYRLPLALKRGYHWHYEPREGAPELNRPICDSRGGFVLSHMRKGIRLTSGIEFSNPDAPADLTQIKREHAIAETIFPLGKPVEKEPWVGHRPCLPDMRPVIGPLANRPGVWLNFGHNHHGMTLGPVSGRLLAEMMTGEKPCVNPQPYAADRFIGK